jgi:hypothetical protein
MTDELVDPSYWLVHGLPWSGGPTGMQPAAAAIAPPLVRREGLPADAARILEVADAFHAHHGMRVAFFSDLTRWLDTQGHDWSSLGADWERGIAACDELPGILLTISQRAHIIICDASHGGATLQLPDGSSEQITPQEREVVHQVIERQLVADWPPFARTLTEGAT